MLFIDLDSVVLKNLDFLFFFPELTVSNDQAPVRGDLVKKKAWLIGFLHRQTDKMHRYEILNPGFMVVQPNMSTFQSFIKFCSRLDSADSTMSTAEQGSFIPKRSLCERWLMMAHPP